MVCAIGIVPMSRPRRIGIVGIASPPSTAGTRGKTNLSRMARFAGKDRGASDSFSQSSGKSQAPRLCPKDVHDHPAWTPELGFPPASKWRYTWMLRPEDPAVFFSSNARLMASGRSWTIVEDLGCSNPSNRSRTIVRLVKQPLNNHVCETDVRTTLGLVDPAKQECYEALKAAELGAQGSPLLLSKLNEQHPSASTSCGSELKSLIRNVTISDKAEE